MAAAAHSTADLSLDVARIREDFPILGEKVHGTERLAYLDNAASTQRPRSVIQAMAEAYERYYSNVHRGIHTLSEASTEKFEAARERVRRFLNAHSGMEIVFTSGATAAINLVARSWGDANLRSGDEILLTEMEHHANIVPWHQLAARTGCTIRFLPITDDGHLRMDLLDQHLTPRTRLVAVAAVSNVLGVINPVREIADRAHAAGALLLVDAAQSVPHTVTDVQQLGCDFLAFSGHKMLGPTGIGVLYGREELLLDMPPFHGGGGMIGTVTTKGFTPAELPAKFEAGTPPIVEAIGMAAAIEYLDGVGIERIHAHEQRLARRAHELLSELGGVRFLGPAPGDKAGIVSFTVEGIHAHDVAQMLDRRGVAVRAGHHCTMPLHTRLKITASSRASFYLYNTMEEVELLASALAEAKKKFRRS
jgi:cysteine desulfurase / selenocysteine lyase